MFEFINYGPEKLQALLLVVLRASGLFLLAPVLGDNAIPKTIRAGLLLLLALLLLPAVTSVPLVGSVWELAGLAVRELVVGMAIGLVFRVILDGVLTAGSLVGFQVGFAMVTVFDDNLSNQVAVIGRLWYMMALIIFMAIGGHHLMIAGLADSYGIIPLGGAAFNGPFADLLIKFTAYIFVVALKVAAPVTITLFLTDVAMGAIAKTVPTMNVFFVGFPLKITIGLGVLALSLPGFAYLLEKSVQYMDQQMHLIFAAMGEV